MKRYLLALLAVPAYPCDDVPKPPAPEQTDAWAFEMPDGDWTTLVPGWVRTAPYPTCWEIGRVPLRYTDDNDTPQIHEPTPCVPGLDAECTETPSTETPTP